MADGWTEDRIRELMERWAKGESASVIAAALGGGLTRSAVIGKVHRVQQATGTAVRGGTPFTPPVVRLKPTGRPPADSRDNAADPRKVVSLPAVKKQVTKTKPRPQLYDLKPRVSESRGIAMVAPPLPLDRITVFTLGKTECKWPIGDPRSEEFTFCGEKQADGRVYCQYHCMMAYEPPQQRVKHKGDRDAA